MSWHGIRGHDDLVEQFRRAVARDRLASTFLFVGPPGCGKRSFALKLAQALLCEACPDGQLEACGHCGGCRQAAAGSHPDLITVEKPKDRATLPLELLVGDREHRMRAGLCYEITLKPYMGGRKIAIIDDADDLRPEAANCLLKTLEEPPPRSVLILIGTSANKQLPTIRSRCQLIRFRPLPTDVVAELLVEGGHVADAAEARRLAMYSEGSVQRAVALAESDLWDFRRRFLERLTESPPDSLALSRQVTEFIEAAGKAAPPRRARLRQTIAFATEFYRQLARTMTGSPPSEDAELVEAAGRAAAHWSGGVTAAVACADRCLDAASHVDRNANQATLIECWFDDLTQIAASGQPVYSRYK